MIEQLYWSNKYGWTDYELSDSFTDEERARVNLPMESEWESETIHRIRQVTP